jgi:hypothetical protein
VDHRLGAGGAALEVAHEAAGAHQVGKEPLHDPALGQHDEAAHVVAALDDGEDQSESGEAVSDEVAGVAAVLAQAPNTTVLMLGGRVRARTAATVGSWVCAMLSGFDIDLAYLGANGSPGNTA